LMYRAGAAAAVGGGSASSTGRWADSSTAIASAAATSSAGSVLGGLAWPVAGVSMVAMIVLGVLLAVRGGPEVVEHVVYVDRPATKTANVSSIAEKHDDTSSAVQDGRFGASWRERAALMDPATPVNYLSLRDRVLLLGMDALPTLLPPKTDWESQPGAKENRELLHEVLTSLAGKSA